MTCWHGITFWLLVVNSHHRQQYGQQSYWLLVWQRHLASLLSIAQVVLHVQLAAVFVEGWRGVAPGPVEYESNYEPGWAPRPPSTNTATSCTYVRRVYYCLHCLFPLLASFSLFKRSLFGISTFKKSKMVLCFLSKVCFGLHIQCWATYSERLECDGEAAFNLNHS